MRKTRLTAIALVGVACFACVPDVQARTWQSLFAFGDSYTDTGEGYLDGNGPTAIAYLAADLKIPFANAGSSKASGRGLNFAVSGAKTGASEGYWVRPAAGNVKDARFGVGMRNQVQDFIARVSSGSLRFDADATIFFLAGGLNDAGLPTAATIKNLEEEIRDLYAAGGRFFLVALLPTKIPAFSDVGLRLNPALAKIPADTQISLPQAHVATSRWGVFYDDVIGNPARFGLVNTTNECAGRALFGEDPTPCASPDGHFYYHDRHPSTAVHRIVAREMERELADLFR